MSAFDEFDAMGAGTFGVHDTENEDFDMFEAFENSAKNPVIHRAESQDGDTLPTTFGLFQSSSVFPAEEPAPSQPLGSKRPRESVLAPVKLPTQDFRILHQDSAFSSLFKTPEAIILATPIVVNCIGLVYLGCGVDLRVLACSVRNVEYNCSRAPRAVLRLIDPPCSAIIRSNGVVTIVGGGSIQATKTAAELTARIVRCALGLSDLLAVKFRLRTLMVRFDLQHPVRIADLAAENRGCASYEPETFCACIVRLTGTFLSDGSTFEEPTAVAPAQPLERKKPDVSEFDDFGDEAFGDEAPLPQEQVFSQERPAQARSLRATSWSASANVFVSGKVTIIGAKSFDEVVAAYKKLLAMVKPHMKV